jgi:Raf kinase inhibitor-like YbhB/YbcL family protein
MLMLQLTSPSFHRDGLIPDRHTCEGADLSPALSIGVYGDERVRSLALVMEDPDAPHTAWVHWIIYNLPPASLFLREGVGLRSLPAPSRFGKNGWGKVGWAGPCPPSGVHHYVFTLYGLDTVLPDLGEPSRETLWRAMSKHVLGKTELMGTYTLRHPNRRPVHRL